MPKERYLNAFADGCLCHECWKLMCVLDGCPSKGTDDVVTFHTGFVGGTALADLGDERTRRLRQAKRGGQFWGHRLNRHAESATLHSRRSPAQPRSCHQNPPGSEYCGTQEPWFTSSVLKGHTGVIWPRSR